MLICRMVLEEQNLRDKFSELDLGCLELGLYLIQFKDTNDT